MTIKQEYLADLVNDYLQSGRGCCPEEDEAFANLPSLKEAIRLASLAQLPDGRRCKHQQRLTAASLQAAKKILEANLEPIEHAKNFHALWLLIKRLTCGIQGIGEMYIYDTSRRIGAFLKLAPNDRLYLHAGTKEGAAALGLDISKPYLMCSELPRPLLKIETPLIEDFLCIYKRELLQVLRQ